MNDEKGEPLCIVTSVHGRCVKVITYNDGPNERTAQRARLLFKTWQEACECAKRLSGDWHGVGQPSDDERKSGMTTDYILSNVEEKNAATPESFQIAPRKVREDLKPGNQAKLIFEPRFGGHLTERMWVLVTVELGDGKFLGALVNKPAFFARDSLELGDRIEFGAEHVASVDQGVRG